VVGARSFRGCQPERRFWNNAGRPASPMLAIIHRRDSITNPQHLFKSQTLFFGMTQNRPNRLPANKMTCENKGLWAQNRAEQGNGGVERALCLRGRAFEVEKPRSQGLPHRKANRSGFKGFFCREDASTNRYYHNDREKLY